MEELDNVELIKLLKIKKEKQRKKCDKLENQVEELKEKELETKQDKLDELANKIYKEDEEATKAGKNSDRALSFIKVGVVTLLTSLFSLIWTIPLNLFWYSLVFGLLSIVEMGVVSGISDKFSDKQVNHLNNRSRYQKQRDALEKEESETLTKLQAKLQKEYDLYDKICEELNTLENFEKIERQQRYIAKKYANNTKKTTTKQEKTFKDKVNKIIKEDTNLLK